MNASGDGEKIKNHLEAELVDYKLLFENIPSPYLILKPDLTIIAVTQSYLDVSKRERENILYRGIFEVFPDDPHDPEASGVRNLRASLERVISGKVLDTMAIQKYNIADPNSTNGAFLERYWRPANFPVLNKKGDLVYIIHHVEDITNFIQAQNRANSTEIANLELKEIQFFLESILENIPNMVFVKDAKDLKFVKFNKAGEELLGYSQSELIGKNDYDFFPKSQADFFISKDRAVLASGKVLDIPEEPIQTRLKGERILHTKKVPLYDENKNNLFLIGISEDITDKIDVIEARLAQKSAEEMADRKIKFLDIAAHELRTPITSLSLLIQIAQRQIEKGNPLTIDILARLREPADRLSRLVIDLLDMSRLERGLLILLPARTDIALLISKCVDEFRIQAPKRNFIFNKPQLPLEIDLDPVRINQVLSNLLDNAVKYTSEGDIVVTAEEKKNSIRVSIIDQGPGISKDQQAMLFSAFSRGSSDATIKASGLGLGLSVSHGIIDLHGGTIGVDSEEGRGSTFYFELPKKDTKNGSIKTKDNFDC